MNKKAMAAMIVIGAATAAQAMNKTDETVAPDAAAEEAVEPCYGVVKAGKNDCYANGHVCAGMSRTNADPYEWINLPVGLCDKLALGSTKPGGRLLEQYKDRLPKK